MPFQAVPNAAGIVINAELDGEKCVTTLGAGLISPATITALMLQTLADGVATWVADFYLQALPAKYIAGLILARTLAIEDGPYYENTSNSGILGDLPGAILPNNCSCAVAFKTGLGGRTNRGRNYWPSFLESEVTDQRVLGGKQTAILAAYDALIGPNAIATGWVWSVISRKIIDGPGLGRAIPVTTVVFNDDVIDSQRRRLPKRGQ